MATGSKWTIADATANYRIGEWGAGYFAINDAGNVEVLSQRKGHPPIDLKELVDGARRRGILPPMILRFSDVLRRRIDELHEAFAAARKEYGYRGEYRGVYPVKVNQDRWVLEEIVQNARVHHYGLEAGTKPELLAVLALMVDDEALLVCNGYKDAEYVEAALMAQRLGRKVIIVVEKLSELELVSEVAARMKVTPHLGVRVKLSTRGAGRWEHSGGDRAKFGLSPTEVLAALKYLKEHDLLGGFEMLHFHLGSQISSIGSVKEAVREAARFYAELRRLGAPLCYLDVGGGLAVDYEGTQSPNYTVEEYARDVVFYTMEVCDAAGVPHPTLVSESGRAVVAHHAVLVSEVLGVSRMVPDSVPESLPDDANLVVKSLFDLHRELSEDNYLEFSHDAADAKTQLLQLFSLGHLDLEQRVMGEQLYWSLSRRILDFAAQEDVFPPELEALEPSLADIYFCNFSIFQSLPDAWAIGQLFPVMPIHRLNEDPTRGAILADITCDSDGRLDRFVQSEEEGSSVLAVHDLRDEHYYLGFFLVGAYQESLGDLHNLFGKTNALTVRSTEDGYRIEHVEPGDTVTEVLQVAGFDRADLVRKMRSACESALAAGRIAPEDTKEILRFYEAGLSGYTYLERE